MPLPCTIVIMAKAPVPGQAKTRLAPALGRAGAAALAERMLDHAVMQALTAGLGPVTLCCAPDAAHPAFARHGPSPRLRLTVQAAGDLGARMARAFDEAASPGHRVLLIGTDAPALDAPLLRRAAAALPADGAVFVPALDGGYALIGLSRPAPFLFDAMPWSTAGVMAETRRRLVAAGWRHAELPAIHDIDDPPDLQHLPPGWLAGLGKGN